MLPYAATQVDKCVQLLLGVYSLPSNSIIMLGICIHHLFSLIHKFEIFAGIVNIPGKIGLH